MSAPILRLPATTDAGSSGPVIPSIAFDALLRHRAAAVAQLHALDAAVRAYRAIGDELWGDEDHPRLSAPYAYREPINQRPNNHGPHLGADDWLSRSIADVDAALWEHLLDRSGIRSFMDHKAREEWAAQIEKRHTPPLIAENVRSTFEALYSRRAEFFERGVIGVFRSLSWDYKTNQPQKFGKRLILQRAFDSFGHLSARASDGLDDLERAFHILDGKPEPDHRSGIGNRIRQATTRDVSDEYLAVRMFKNGNGHVTFLRADLVDRLNRILARHFPDALPASRDAA